MAKLNGKTALISGAGRGIGRATAQLFAAEGANLILIARTLSQLEETAVLCADRGVEVFRQAVDLAMPDQAYNLLRELPPNFAVIDILVNNAARFDKGILADFPLERFAAMMQTNITGTFYLTQRVLGRMPAGSTIVNVSSLSGCVGTEKFAGFGAYNISKYGLWGLTEILALELKEKGIRVNQVSPSGVDTTMFKAAVPPGVQADLTADDVARKILWLASSESGEITGENLLLTEPVSETN